MVSSVHWLFLTIDLKNERQLESIFNKCVIEALKKLWLNPEALKPGQNNGPLFGNRPFFCFFQFPLSSLEKGGYGSIDTKTLVYICSTFIETRPKHQIDGR